MRKIISGILCLFTAGLLLTGCHGNKEVNTFQVPETFDVTKDIEITFWAKNDTNKAQTLVYENAIEAFQELYPNVTVNLRLYTDYGKIYNDVITNISTDTTPNVCITYPDHIATYMKGDSVVNLDSLISDEKYGLGGSDLRFDGPDRQEMVEKFLSECILNGSYYALPYMRSTEACYINKTYVEALGYEVPDELTWDFIWEVSEKAVEKNADGTYKLNGQNVMIPFIYKSTDNMMIQYLKQNNSGYCDSAGNILLFNEDTKNFLYEISSHVKSGAFSTFKISSYPANFLNAGQSVFAIDSTAGATWMGSEAPLCDICSDDIVDFEIVVRRIPQVDNSEPYMISQGPSICIFNKADSQEVLASWLFAQFLLTDEVQIAYSQTEGYVPVTLKAQQSEAYVDYLSRAGEDNEVYYKTKIEAARLLLDNIENTFVTPVYDGSTSLRDAAGQLIENTAKSTRRKETIDEAYMTKLFDDVTALYRLDQREGATTVDTPLPAASKALIIVLITVWVGIAVVQIVKKVKSRFVKIGR